MRAVVQEYDLPVRDEAVAVVCPRLIVPIMAMNKDARRERRLFDVSIETPKIIDPVDVFTALTPEHVRSPVDAYFHSHIVSESMKFIYTKPMRFRHY